MVRYREIIRLTQMNDGIENVRNENHLAEQERRIEKNYDTGFLALEHAEILTGGKLFFHEYTMRIRLIVAKGCSFAVSQACV